MKSCNECLLMKPFSEFYTHAKMRDGHLGRCKACHRAKQREHVASKDPVERQRQRYKWHRTRIVKKYGLTSTQYEAMLKSQNGGCAICGRTDAGPQGGMLAIDHDHETGEVRGLLCHDCNSGLGRYHDDPERLIAAAAYLLSQRDVLGTVF